MTCAKGKNQRNVSELESSYAVMLLDKFYVWLILYYWMVNSVKSWFAWTMEGVGWSCDVVEVLEDRRQPLLCQLSVHLIHNTTVNTYNGLQENYNMSLNFFNSIFLQCKMV